MELPYEPMKRYNSLKQEEESFMMVDIQLEETKTSTIANARKMTEFSIIPLLCAKA
jgi:hypothetical protein